MVRREENAQPLAIDGIARTLSFSENDQLAFPYAQPEGEPIRQGGGQRMASGYAAGPASPPRADPPRHPVAGVRRTSIAETLDDAWGLTEDRPPSEQASLWLDRGREDLPIVSEPSLYKSRSVPGHHFRAE